MTIDDLLRCSLKNLQSKSATSAHRKATSDKDNGIGLSDILISARMQDAEVVVSRYLDRPDNAAAGDGGSRLGGWVFHR